MKGRMTLLFQKVAIEAFTRVIMRSPVDTGRFRGNWQVQIGSIPDGVLALDDRDGTATVSKATAAAQQFKPGQMIYLTNNLPYAQRLETGWSKQAPGGMVGITVQELQPVVDKALAQVKMEKP